MLRAHVPGHNRISDMEQPGMNEEIKKQEPLNSSLKILLLVLGALLTIYLLTAADTLLDSILGWQTAEKADTPAMN